MTDGEHNKMLDKIADEVINSYHAEITNKYYLPEDTIEEYQKDMNNMIGFLDNLKEDEEDEEDINMIEFLDKLKKSKNKMKDNIPVGSVPPDEKTNEEIYNERMEPDTKFTKDDSGKPRFDLLPASSAHVIDSSIMKMYVIALTSKDIEKLLDLSEHIRSSIWDVVEVLTHGAEKYSDNNWKTAKDNNRYWSALGRHLFAYDLDNNSMDEESGFTHGAHAMCNIIFLLELLSNGESK